MGTLDGHPDVEDDETAFVGVGVSCQHGDSLHWIVSLSNMARVLPGVKPAGHDRGSHRIEEDT